MRRLVGKADDDVGRESQVGNRGPQVVHEIAVRGDGVVAGHALEHASEPD